MNDIRTNQPAKLDQAGINRIVTVLAFLIVQGVILFVCAGRLDWWEAWAFEGIYLLGIIAVGLVMLVRNPEVINERGRMPENTKSWDKVIAVFYLIFMLGTWVVAGLDARFAWSTMPLALKIIGGIGLAVWLLLIFWVMRVNTFLSTLVRIQDERGHYTVTSGPYRYVRHPMYATMVILFWAAPLLLGSWWALAPAALNGLVFVVRTALEDRTLQAELPGYADYARRVRYRLVPGLW